MLLQAWYVILLCVTLFVLARRHWSKRRARARGHAPVPIATSTRLAQDITREVLALEPRGSHRQHRRVPMDFPKVRILLQQIERYLPEQLKERAHLWLGNDHELPVEPHEALRGAAAGAAGDWWPELLIGLAGEPRFAGSGTDADDQFTPGADAAELLGRVQEILAACKDPRMHEALDGLSIRCVLEKAPHHFVWFAEAPGSPVPFVVSETVIQTTLPIDAVVWSIYSPEERLKWDKSPFVAHEILHPGGVQSRAFRDFLYSRVTIAPGISDRDLVQERFLTRLPDQSGYAILMSSCSDEIAASLGRPDSTDVVRTKDLLSAYILKPCEHGILLTTLSQKDVGSHVPSFFQHMARSVGKRKPLEMAQQLERHCRRS